MRTRDWAAVADHYRSVPDQEPMLRLVEHIVGAPCATKVFGGTSMFTLVVGQTAEIREDQEIICVDFVENAFRFTLCERGWWSAAGPDARAPRRVSAEQGIAAFERLLGAKRWD